MIKSSPYKRKETNCAECDKIKRNVESHARISPRRLTHLQMEGQLLGSYKTNGNRHHY